MMNETTADLASDKIAHNETQLHLHDGRSQTLSHRDILASQHRRCQLGHATAAAQCTQNDTVSSTKLAGRLVTGKHPFAMGRRSVEANVVEITDSGSSTDRRKSRTIRRSGNERVSWYQRRVGTHVSLCQQYFLEKVLKRISLVPSQHGRRVHIGVAHDKPLVDERRGHAFISNSIRSSRYTFYDFLPKQFFFQATRLNNAYFIAIGIPQAIPGLSTTGNYTTILPLFFFILLSMFKEGYDDYRRHRMDTVENNTQAVVLRPKTHLDIECSATSSQPRARMRLPTLPRHGKGSAVEAVEEPREPDGDKDLAWSNVCWRDIRVGDVLRLRRNDAIPADIVLLHATGENSVAYIETMALDGETNLKSKQALLPLSKACQTIADIRSCAAQFVVEDPNKNLYDFNGKVTIDEDTLPLTLNEVVFRGSILRNTEQAVGLVINTGEECKIRMNANHHPQAKKPYLEKFSNRVVMMLIFYVVILAIGCSIGYILWRHSFERHAWYLHKAGVRFKAIIIGFLITFNNIIPLALYVSLEIVKLGQMLMVQSDVEMYDEATDTPMKCNTNTILENLGQISYILSDKTGTLTDNVMKFRGLSVGGTMWMHGQVENIRDGNQASIPISKLHFEQPERPDKQPFTHGKSQIVVDEQEVTAYEMPELGTSSTVYARRSTTQEGRTEAQRTTLELLDIIATSPSSILARKARELILGMALCHTALPEDDKDGMDFQASSPDELALVRAAQDLGYLLIQRSSQTIDLMIGRSGTYQAKESYQVLDIVEFSSKRKRMSIVVRCPDGRIWLICKGADSAIIPRLRQAEIAMRKSVDVRQSMDAERRLKRRSEQHEPRNSFGARPSLTLHGRGSMDVRVHRDYSRSRPTLEVPRASNDARNKSITREIDETQIFTHCFRHLDEFATEGLRTLLFAHRYLDESEYMTWKKTYQNATTALVDRQNLIEAAGEILEQGFDLLGASAIEDKLQDGVPQTIDRLQRANIRIWMLTGDKRETAISIAHSAGIAQPTSVVSVLDSTKGDLHGQICDVLDEREDHRVVVIDGHTLTVVQANAELKQLFFGTLIATIESVIVCRASPAQKAEIVKGIKTRLPGLTLAIGDGANDIAMIQEAHVGIGISGKEGLQAARVADYSIAQFRYLQRLLLVHGRYNYVRTAQSFIRNTFWKEMLFYFPQSFFQRYNGYTGSSLYESWSLTVLNTLFTSLCVILPGIFEQDLRPETLLAVPELYVFGQRNQGLNITEFLRWMFLAVIDGMIIWFVSWTSYGKYNITGDNGLFALGDLIFSLGIIWTNWKLLIIETNYKTKIIYAGFFITVGGWFAWNGFMSVVYLKNLSPFDVRHGFSQTFGRDLSWWATFLLAFSIMTVLELVYGVIKRQLIVEKMWPPWRHYQHNRDRYAEDLELELWQEMERDPLIRQRLCAMAYEKGNVMSMHGREMA